ncbi:MAG: outer membrane beta-barrel protein [Candidatus Sulfotelmatobacter sp.]
MPAGSAIGTWESFMSALKIMIVISLLVAGAVSSANAQWSSTEPHRNIEITPFGGSRFGGVINTNSQGTSPIDELTIKSTWDYGVLGDIDLAPYSMPGLQAEFMWSRQPTDLGARDAATGIVAPAGDVTLDNYHWGVLYNFRDPRARLRPFVGGGLGFTHFSSAGALPFENRLSFNFGGGVKYFFVRNAGVRFDLRWMPSRTTSHVATFFDPFFGFYQANVNNYAEQFQANLGLILRF